MKKLITILLMLSLVLGCFAALVACEDDYTADNTEHFTDITDTLKLEKSYEGKSYVADGIGEVTVTGHADGDTTSFHGKVGGDSIYMRYFGCNTPESTTKVEKWGKTASNFTKERLNAATVVVLEGPNGKAETEGYGRYLGFVWYKTAEDTDLRCLNLELVENGYATSTANAGDTYYSYFKEAADFAKKIKIRIHSDLPDPNYNDNVQEVTMKELHDNWANYTGKKVCVDAYLTSCQEGSTYMYEIANYDAATDKVYKFNLYAGHSNDSAALNLKVGYRYRVVGTVQDHSSGPQLSGVNCTDYNPNLDNDTTVTTKEYYFTFDGSKTYNMRWRNVYSDVTVTSSSVADGVLTIVGTAKPVSDSGYGSAATFTFKLKVDSDFVNVYTQGTTFSAKGIKLDSSAVTILSTNDITKK